MASDRDRSAFSGIDLRLLVRVCIEMCPTHTEMTRRILPIAGTGSLPMFRNDTSVGPTVHADADISQPANDAQTHWGQSVGPP